MPRSHYEESPNQMRNINLLVVNGQLILQVDLAKELGPSESGKSTLIANSGSQPRVPGYDNVRFSLSVYKFPEAEQKAA
jgi:hypothetical protein